MMHYENDFGSVQLTKKCRNKPDTSSMEANESIEPEAHYYSEIETNNEEKLELPVRGDQKCYFISSNRRKVALVVTGIIVISIISVVWLYSHSTKDNKGTDSLKHTTFAPNKTLDVDCVNTTKQINCRDCSNFQVSKAIVCCNENECEDSTTTNANEIVQTVTESTVNITVKCEKTTCLNGGVCIVFGNNTLCQCSSQYFGNKCHLTGQEGTQFLLVIPEQYDSGMASLRSNVLIATDNSTLIWVYSSTSRRNTSAFIHISHPYYNPESNLITRDGYNTAGIEISSEVPMSMYGFILSDWDDNSEGYLAFPVQYAAKSYIVPSFTVSKFRGFSFISKSLLTISPLESDTKMQINLKMKSGSLVLNNVKYKNNDTIQIVIQKHETFQLSHSSDLTGTMITANKRFLLISGNICNYIINIAGCNPFIEMVLPINQLDKFYVIPKIATRHTCTVRILAVNFTIVKIKLGENLIKVELQARYFYDFSYTDSSSISASDDVMVIVFPHEEASTRSNSFMMTIHGTNQFLNEYLFVVPEGFTSFLSVVVETEDTHGFVLDDMSVTNDIFDRQSIILESIIFSTFSIRVNSGRHKLTHLKGTYFGLWVYGNARYDGYEYPAGIAMKTHV